MGKRKAPSTPPASTLLFTETPTSKPIVDTHVHLSLTFQVYQDKYASKPSEINDISIATGQAIDSVYDFARVMHQDRVEAVVDVFCWADGIRKRAWKELADSALEADGKWGSMQYWFAIGVHP